MNANDPKELDTYLVTYTPTGQTRPLVAKVAAVDQADAMRVCRRTIGDVGEILIAEFFEEGAGDHVTLR